MEGTDDPTDEAPTLHEAEPDFAGAAASPPGAPVVVIEYRHPNLWHRLMPAALVLLAALAISSFQRRTPVRLIPNRAQQARKPVEPPTPPEPAAVLARAEVPASPEVPSPPAPTPDPAPPLSFPDPPPSDADATAKAEPAADSPFEVTDGGLEVVRAELPQPAATPTEPGPLIEAAPGVEPAARPEPAPAAPEVSREAIVADIEREAQVKEAERQEAERLKPRARALVASEAVAKSQANRAEFRNELRALLKAANEDLPDAIDRLAFQFGREIPDEVRARYKRSQRSRPLRLLLADEVALMRTFGLPEPMILDFLANRLHKTLNTRSGPRNEGEVMVAAARQLLAIPLTAAAPAAATKPGDAPQRKANRLTSSGSVPVPAARP